LRTQDKQIRVTMNPFDQENLLYFLLGAHF
jgi:hypothetical protein